MRSAIGPTVTAEQLEGNPHPVLAALRVGEPVSHLAALGGWLVTSHALALEAMRDAATFTVQDPRFTTARVIGESMLSLDGHEHVRHRDPFQGPFRPREVRERFAQFARQEAHRRLDSFAALGRAELRRSFAGPLAAAVIARALGLQAGEEPELLDLYDAIVAAVTALSGSERSAKAALGDGKAAFAALSRRLEQVIEAGPSDSLLATAARTRPGLPRPAVVANAAVLLFGGIETTEGMITNATLHLLLHPTSLGAVRADPSLLDAAVEESLRLEPAAAVIDRYATRDTRLGDATIRRGELVRISLAAANRDPAVFVQPDAFRLDRPRGRSHLAFAQGPHVCLGVHLARLEAREGLAAMLGRLSGLRLDPGTEVPAVSGLVFRKPSRLPALWDA
ncbi:MAG: cytochrome P450 [Solirubrobacteraceae bacterium]